MAFGSKRHRHALWGDGDALTQYRDRAHDLYDDGVTRTADLYHHGRDRAVDAYGRGRRRAADAYSESRDRLSRASDALAGRRTVDRGPVAGAAALGVLAGAALVIGAVWLLRRTTPPPPVVPAADPVDDLIAGAGGVTGPMDRD